MREASPSLSQALDAFLDDVGIRLAPLTRVTYAHHLRPLRVLDWPLTDTACRQLVADQVRAGKAPRTVNSFAGALMSFVKFCRAEGWLYTDPTAHLSTPRIEERPHRYLSADEVARVRRAAEEMDEAAHAGRGGFGAARLQSSGGTFTPCQAVTGCGDCTKYRLIVSLLLTGLRAAELLAIRREDIADGLITVRGKGARWRYVPLPEEAIPWLPAAGPLFPFVYKSLHKYVRQLGARAGIAHVHPHLFRHTFASHAVASLDVPTVMAVGGWRSQKLVEHYARSTYQQAAARKAAGLFRTPPTD